MAYHTKNVRRAGENQIAMDGCLREEDDAKPKNVVVQLDRTTEVWKINNPWAPQQP